VETRVEMGAAEATAQEEATDVRVLMALI